MGQNELDCNIVREKEIVLKEDNRDIEGNERKMQMAMLHLVEKRNVNSKRDELKNEVDR